MEFNYKLVGSKGYTGYKGVRLSDDNLTRFPESLLKVWEKAGIIKKVKPKKVNKDD